MELWTLVFGNGDGGIMTNTLDISVGLAAGFAIGMFVGAWLHAVLGACRRISRPISSTDPATIRPPSDSLGQSEEAAWREFLVSQGSGESIVQRRYLVRIPIYLASSRWPNSEDPDFFG